ncbi:hypothetical protein UPYG_G00035930 [Umbra pygmaea]|uniref:Uncharacterized protein n=1 Tax=Umbra pygmaea TaxID=75934 RepID=A0ABD0XR75_UMBPY
MLHCSTVMTVTIAKKNSASCSSSPIRRERKSAPHQLSVLSPILPWTSCCLVATGSCHGCRSRVSMLLLLTGLFKGPQIGLFEGHDVKDGGDRVSR